MTYAADRRIAGQITGTLDQWRRVDRARRSSNRRDRRRAAAAAKDARLFGTDPSWYGF